MKGPLGAVGNEPPADATVAILPGDQHGRAGNQQPEIDASGAIQHDETDGRARYEWTTGYAPEAKTKIRTETFFVVLVLITALAGIYLTWSGTLVDAMSCATCSPATFRRYSYFFFSGMLGSILFGGKYLYHVVARGFWHEDRQLWRFLSPLLSASLALAVAAAIDSGMLGLAFRAGTHASCVAMGFFTGYFADKALAKMTEVADVVFGVRDIGPSARTHDNKKQRRPPSG